MRLVPASVPSGWVTSQSPTQKSNCRCSGPEHGFGGGVEGASCAQAGVANASRAPKVRGVATRRARVVTGILSSMARRNPPADRSVAPAGRAVLES